MFPNENEIDYPSRFSDRLDNVVGRIGNVVSWSTFLLIFTIVTNVILRYVFNRGMIALEELQWHLFALIILFGLSYTMVKDAHIKVDVLYSQFSPRRKAWIDLFSIVFMLMPFVCIVFWHSVDFVYRSWELGESSVVQQGLPWRWLIKSVIPISFILFGVAAVSRIIRILIFLFGRSRT